MSSEFNKMIYFFQHFSSYETNFSFKEKIKINMLQWYLKLNILFFIYKSMHFLIQSLFSQFFPLLLSLLNYFIFYFFEKKIKNIMIINIKQITWEWQENININIESYNPKNIQFKLNQKNLFLFKFHNK